MSFDKVDEIFSDWAKASNLFVSTEHKGYEVRSVDLVDNKNQKWQLWLVPVDETEEVVIHYWDYRQVGRHRKVKNVELKKTLNEIEKNIKNGNSKNT